jgi:hypothetical protein
MTILPIRSDNAYVGIAKQASQGVPVAPSLFVRWLDGTKLDIDLKTDTIYEGDGSRRLGIVVKKSQSVKATIVFNPRPIELGFFETAALGIGADTVTPPTVNTTLAAAATKGASTLSLASNTGLTSNGTAVVNVSPGTANEEIVSIVTPVTGTGPYTATIANSGVLKNNHSSGDTVVSSTTHTITDQSDGNYYTLEFGLGSLFGANGATLRITDCKLDTIKRSGKAGGLLELTVEFLGIASVLQSTPSTVVLERHAPFLYQQGVWTLNGSQLGDALAVESIDIDQKNAVDGVQTEQLTFAALIFGNIAVTTKAKLTYQNNNLLALTYFNGGTTDAQAIGIGSLSVVFTQPDQYHSVTYTLSNLNYTQVTLPAPKKDGKHYVIDVTGEGSSGDGTYSNVIQAVVTNAQTTAY